MIENYIKKYKYFVLYVFLGIIIYRINKFNIFYFNI